MTDQKRNRRAARAGAHSTPAPEPAYSMLLLDDSEPALGDLKFDEWFETPVFESDPDERLEELATSRRGPLRLAANTFLRFNARASQARRTLHSGDEGFFSADGGHEPASAAEALALVSIDDPATEALEAEPEAFEPEVFEPGPQLAARRSPSRPLKAAHGTATRNGNAARNGTATRNGTPTRNGTAAKNGTAARNGTAGKAAPGSRNGVTRSRAATNGTSSAPPVREPVTAEPASMRQRLNAALDRWAEREAATQTRLERLILPKRWQA